MDEWSPHVRMTGAEIDVQEALLALERVLGRQELFGSLRVRLEEAASALRELQTSA